MMVQKDNHIKLTFNLDVKFVIQNQIFLCIHELHFIRTRICVICVSCDYKSACDGPFKAEKFSKQQ